MNTWLCLQFTQRSGNFFRIGWNGPEKDLLEMNGRFPVYFLAAAFFLGVLAFFGLAVFAFFGDFAAFFGLAAFFGDLAAFFGLATAFLGVFAFLAASFFVAVFFAAGFFAAFFGLAALGFLAFFGLALGLAWPHQVWMIQTHRFPWTVSGFPSSLLPWGRPSVWHWLQCYCHRLCS